MPRALKTYITNLGFFELAIAAPSMKAALEAWGMSHNAFQQGFARQTDDPKIIAATAAQPGIVLRRAVGTTAAFSQDAALPTSLPNIKPAKVEAPKGEAPKARQPRTTTKAPVKKSSRAELISFEKERAKRERKTAVVEAQAEKKRNTRDAAVYKAESALEKASEQHQSKLAGFHDDQARLDQLFRKERDRWEAERKKLDAAIDRAKR